MWMFALILMDISEYISFTFPLDITFCVLHFTFLSAYQLVCSPYPVNSTVLTKICSQGMGWWPLSAGFWKCQQQFLPSKTQFGFNLKENIVAQGAGYPTSIESRSDVIRKCVKIVRLWTVIVFWPRSEKAVKLFYFRSIFYHFESTLEPN